MLARLPVLMLAGAALAAQAQQAAPQAQAAGPAGAGVARVTVSATRDPVDKSYRKMIKGAERFAREHALAPQAALRFQLLPRTPGSKLDGITLRVAGDTMSLPIPVAPDHSFELPYDAQALREDAAVLANRHTASMTWRALIRSPGLAPGTRRLGDLRLECRVGTEAGLVSNNGQLFAWLSNALSSPEQVCNSPDGNYLFFADEPLFSVRLRAGSRIETLPFSMLYAGGRQTPEMLRFCDCQVLLDRTYYAPLWDASWPDETIVEFDYMRTAPADLPALPPASAGGAR